MDIASFHQYCLSKKAVTESFPFDEQTLVFKVGSKVFAITSLDQSEFNVNLKCIPERSEELRDQFPESIIPGFHMNKKHWNTVTVEDSDVDEETVKELIDHSYDLVFSKLTKKQKSLLG